ncbi:TetR/AcrR family transcriptional regulator [Amycolatopsis pigmentata]|uniref:TetR/AcrR family transcriptional regulator n=1 Tax=Amycolatopsis pigmentata TaxID=450801 RepID=A0ABW5FM18_9PSEU
MTRLTRAESQERNRARVLAAARDEFAERGFRDAKIDVIAERAELTRGAVYSNFPGKRALYFAVLARLAAQAPVAPHAQPGDTVKEALGALARAWVARLPEPGERLGLELIPEIVADERVTLPFTQLMKLDALLLALALERLRPPGKAPEEPPARLVRLAETVLTTLHGASRMAAAAPGFVEPFDVISACEQLAGLKLNDFWAPPRTAPAAERVALPWVPPSAIDLVRAAPAELHGDGVVTVVGLHRLSAVEQAVRAGNEVTAVLVTGDPGELAPLTRLVVGGLCGCLRQAVPASAWPRIRVVCDESGTLAAAAGVRSVSDETEVAVRVEDGRIVATAEGRGACHAVARDDLRPVPAR